MAMRVAGLIGVAALCQVASMVAALAQTCSRADFEAVVGQAAEALRELNQTNKPGFQSKLRQLKVKRGWNHDTFLLEAAPIVQDATIAGYDSHSSGILARIEQLGAQGASAAEPDCRLLDDVRQSMQALVQVQKTKWTYMFGKVEAELRK